jgi:hypothetical protein
MGGPDGAAVSRLCAGIAPLTPPIRRTIAPVHPPTHWNIYKVAKKAWLGTVGAGQAGRYSVTDAFTPR